MLDCSVAQRTELTQSTSSERELLNDIVLQNDRGRIKLLQHSPKIIF